MAALTNITPPRVALIDERTGAITREWYLFFLSLFQLTGGGTTTVSLSDLELAPSPLSNMEVPVSDFDLSPPPKQFRNPRYGSFYDTTTQAAAVINTAYAMTFNTTDLTSGVYIGTPTSRIYVDTPNIYNIQFSAQIDKTTAGVALIWIWLRKNGVDVPQSATQIRIQGNNAEAVAAWNFLLQMNAGDYFELMWEVGDAAVQLLSEAATAVHPAIPSVILTVTDNISSLEV